MKRLILTLITLLAASLGSMAQVFSRQNLLDDHPYNFYSGSSSERGHDRLDSLYYLNITTYTLPFHTEKEQQAVAEYVLRILETYDELMETATGGFKADPSDPSVESKRLSMYYAEELEPFIVGGKGRSYVVVRQQDPNNINYRTCEGVEWWSEGTKKKAVVKFRVFSLYGPMTEQHYERAFSEHLGTSGGIADKVRSAIARDKVITPYNLIEQIKTLAYFYKDNGSTTDDAVVQSINERVTKYLSMTCKTASDIFSEEARLLYRILGKIPGYSAAVHYPGGMVVTGNFERLANHYPQGKSADVNWFIKGDAKCTGESRNFLMEIYIEK